MSYKVEFLPGDGDDWETNGLRFATKDEAEQYAGRLEARWQTITKTKVVEDDGIVNAWFNGDVHLGLDEEGDNDDSNGGLLPDTAGAEGREESDTSQGGEGESVKPGGRE